MAAQLKELREKRGLIVAQINAAGAAYDAAGTKFTVEERTNWDKINDDERKLFREIEALQKEEDTHRSVAERIAQLSEIESTGSLVNAIPQANSTI